MQTAVHQCNSWIAEHLCPSQWKKQNLYSESGRLLRTQSCTKYKVLLRRPFTYIMQACKMCRLVPISCASCAMHSTFKTNSAKCKMCRPVPTWSRLVAPTSAAPGLGVELVQLLRSAVQSALYIMLAWTGGLQLLHSA